MGAAVGQAFARSGMGSVVGEPRQFALSAAQFRAAAVSGAVSIVGAAVVLIVLTAVFMLIVAPEGSKGGPATWGRVGIDLLGLAFRGSLELQANGTLLPFLDESDITGRIAMTWTPMVITAAVLTLVLAVARRTERESTTADVRTAISASAASGAAGALALAVLAVLAHGNLYVLGAAGSVALSPWSVLPGSFLAITAVTLLARLGARQIVRQQGGLKALLRARLGVWYDDVRASGTFLLMTLVVTMVCVGVWVGWLAFSELGNDGGSSSSSSGTSAWSVVQAIVGAILAVVLLAPGFVVMVWGAALGASVGAGGSVNGRGLEESGSLPDSTIGLLAGDAPAQAYLVLAPLLAVVLIVGLRGSLRQAVGSPLKGRIGRTAVLLMVFWLLLALASRISFAGYVSSSDADDGAGTATAFFGLTLTSVLVVAGLWAVIFVGGGALLGRSLAPAFPAVTARLGGKRMHDDWFMLLKATTLAHNKPLPAVLKNRPEPMGGLPAPLPPPDARQRKALLGTGAVVAVAVVATAGYFALDRFAFGPSHTAGSFADALEDGDVEDVLGLLSADTLDDLDRTLLVNQAIKTSLDDASVEDVTVDGDAAYVTVKERLGEEEQETSYTLVKDGKKFGIWQTWKIEQPFSALAIDTGGRPTDSAATANSVPVEAQTYPVLPGEYEVKAPATGMLQESSESATVFGNDTQSITLTTELDPKVSSSAETAVDKLLTTCAESHETAPDGCPFSTWNTSVTDITWTIVSKPQLGLTLAEDGSVVVLTEVPGQVQASGEVSDWFGETSPYEDTQEVYVSGILRWDGQEGSEPVLELESGGE